MKYILFLVIFIFSLLLLPTVVLGRATTPNLRPSPPGNIMPPKDFEQKLATREARREEIRQRIEERIEIRIQEREEKRATREARFAEIRKARITAFFGHLTKRLEALVERLNILISRIESRLDKIAEANEDIDTTSIQANIQEAKDLLAETEDYLSVLEVESFLDNGDPKTAFAEVREIIQQIKVNLIEVHRILVHVIGDIKGLRVGTEVKPSPSPEPSPVVTPTPEPTETPTPTPTPVSIISP